MADPSLKLLSEKSSRRLEYRWLYPFVMSQFLDEGCLPVVAGVDDFEVAEATYRAAITRWPAARITLRQGRSGMPFHFQVLL